MTKKGDSATPDPRVPAQAAEFCRLIAKILRRRGGDIESVEDQSSEPIPGVAPTEHPDIDDKSEEEQG